MFKRSILLGLVFSTLFLSTARGESPNSSIPVIPARIGGPVMVNGISLRQATDAGYTFTVTRPDGSAFDALVQDADGLNESNFYTINIPVLEKVDLSGSAHPGDTAVIHVYKGSSELLVTSPNDASFTLGKAGSVTLIPLEVQANQTPVNPPSQPRVIQRKTVQDIESAPVNLGSVATGGNLMGLSINFPVFTEPVDIWIAVQLPNGTLAFLNSEHDLTLDIAPFGVGVKKTGNITIIEEFEACSLSDGKMLSQGHWTIYWLIAPTNGGNISLIDFDKGAYELEYYAFDLHCLTGSAH